jgi:hypothetical protein
MIQICCSRHHVGDRRYGEKEPLKDRTETHGICDACFPKDMEDIRTAMKKHRETRGRGDAETWR